MVLSPSFIFSWTTIANISAYFQCIVSYCCSSENETWKEYQSASFSTDNGRTSSCPSFTVFLTIKTSSQNISIKLLQISLKLHEHRGGYWKKKLPWMILEGRIPVPKHTATSKIGNSVISSLCQLRCHCNPDYNKFSSLTNTAVVVIFPNFCYGDVVYAQTWEVRPWKTLSSHLKY